MNELLARLKAPTPAFWKRVQKLAAAGLALVVALQAGTSGPPWLSDALPTAFTVLTTIVTVAQFTCADAPNADQDSQKTA